MSDQNAFLARRLSAKRWPQIACAAALASGLSTAALLILAAGNSHAGPNVATLIAAGSLQPPASHAFQSPASFYERTASNMRGTIDLAGAGDTEQTRSVAGLQ